MQVEAGDEVSRKCVLGLFELIFELGDEFHQLLLEQGKVDCLSVFVGRPFLLSSGQVLNNDLNFDVGQFDLLSIEDSIHIVFVFG